MNQTEQEFIDFVNNDGKYRLFKAGYPDFMLLHKETGRIIFVEVKKNGQLEELSDTQKDMAHHLTANGLTCFVWSPTAGWPWRRLTRLLRGCSGRAPWVGAWAASPWSWLARWLYTICWLTCETACGDVGMKVMGS